ncbi:MAG TPA: hypothetical protein VIX73_24730 [Kofleriaceae bacterium]|jgi:hypothetical protein
MVRIGICLTVLVSSLSLASAETYVSLGVGSDPALHGDARMAASSGDNGGNERLALGIGVSRLSLEGSVSRFGLGGSSATAAGAHLRLRFPVKGGFGIFGRIGLERVWWGTDVPSMSSTADGTVGGLGLEYRLSAPVLGEAGIWAEVSDDRLDTGDGRTGGVRLFTAGLTFGL